jgi:hypothetical protein
MSLYSKFLASMTDITVVESNTPIIKFNNNFQDMYKFSLKKLSILNNDENFILLAYSNRMVTEEIIKSFDIDQSVKNCIIIASVLSVLKDPTSDISHDVDSNLESFILGTSDEKKLIIEMINLIFSSTSVSTNQWKLIPKYVTIFNKIGCVGLFQFVHYFNSQNSSSLYSELYKYCETILNYKYLLNNEYTNEVYYLRLKEILKVFTFMEENKSITIEDIKHILN